MLRDYVKKYYLEQRRNCAESLLRAANEAYGLNLTEADFALLLRLWRRHGLRQRLQAR